jgi:hypothetical protein
VRVPHQLTAKNRKYTVVDDTTIVYTVLAAGMVRDELLAGSALADRSPVAGYTVEVDRREIVARALDGGVFCLSGYVERVFPDLANTAYDVAVTIQAPGYRAAQLTVHVPQNASLPVLVPDVLLRPVPVRVQGRVVDDQGAPIADALVLALDDPHPPQPLNVHPISLRAPLGMDHAVGAPVRLRPLNPAGVPKQLTVPAIAGSTTIMVDSRTSLGAGDILRIGSIARGEFRLIESPPTQPANLSLPGEVRLSRPLRSSYPAGGEVRKVTAGAIVTAASLAQAADAGDAILLLDASLNGDVVQVDDPPNAEYHALGALTDAAGFYHLDGVGRVRELFLIARAAGVGPMIEPLRWTIDYGRPVNLVDVRLA